MGRSWRMGRVLNNLAENLIYFISVENILCNEPAPLMTWFRASEMINVGIKNKQENMNECDWWNEGID